jgi:hypothetical protein
LAHSATAVDAVLALPDFDDPNINKDEAIAGVLGVLLSSSSPLHVSDSSAEDDSPYPEVRSAVANTDDPDLPVSTIRAWVLGLIFAIVIPVSYCFCILGSTTLLIR